MGSGGFWTAYRLRQAIDSQEEREATQRAALRETDAAISAHNRQVELLAYLHESRSEYWDWEEIAAREDPTPPDHLLLQAEVDGARAQLEGFQPRGLGRALGRGERKRSRMAQELDEARKRQSDALQHHRAEVARVAKLRKLAGGVLNGDPDAHAEALNIDDPFHQIPLIRECSADCRGTWVDAEVRIRDWSVIPETMPRTLKSGRLSSKRIPDRLRKELYRDHVVKALLRTANEIYRRLPIQDVYAHAIGPVFDKDRDLVRQGVMASIKFERPKLTEILESEDDFDVPGVLDYFTHRMKFTLGNGFAPVEKLAGPS